MMPVPITMLSLLAQFRDVTEHDKTRAVEKLIKVSTPDYAFFFMVTLSVLMATLGLWIGSAAVVIGSMLIAPILYPIISLALGFSISDPKLIERSCYTIGKSVVLGLIASGTVTWLLASRIDSYSSEIISRTEPSLLYLVVGVIAGVAVSFTLVRPDFSETLAGIAVSVALIPPLAVVGIGLARFDWAVASSSAVLFIVNIIGIVCASMVSFALLNLYGKRHVAETTIKKEEQRVALEHERAEYSQKEEAGKTF